MSTAGTYRIGKTKITVDVEGCVKCGTLWSSDWFVTRVIDVVIATKKYQVAIHICADCQKKKPVTEIML